MKQFFTGLVLCGALSGQIFAQRVNSSAQDVVQHCACADRSTYQAFKNVAFGAMLVVEIGFLYYLYANPSLLYNVAVKTCMLGATVTRKGFSDTVTISFGPLCQWAGFPEQVEKHLWR